MHTTIIVFSTRSLAAAGLVGASALARTAGAEPEPEILVLQATIRDFTSGHPDFGVAPAGGLGHTAGNIAELLGADGMPLYTGTGFLVASEWVNSGGQPIAPHLAQSGGTDGCGELIADVPGWSAGPHAGAISSPESFGEWFRDLPSVNMSAPLAITLTDERGDGVFGHECEEFTPIDGLLLGNEGQPHNTLFTCVIEAGFTYEACAGQWLAFDGGDDAWVFVNGRLVLDAGGPAGQAGIHQWVHMDRLGLADGEPVTLLLLLAQRRIEPSQFWLKTTIRLESAPGALTYFFAAD